MRLRWDWLGPVVTVPYVPTLGPVHPDALSQDLFDAVIDVSGTGRFLPYDKDRRWSHYKDERVLVGEIIHEPHRTVIPTLSSRGRGVVKVHHYSATPPRRDAAAEWAQKWCATYGAASARVIWFQASAPRQPAAAASCTRLLLKTFGEDQQQPAQGLVRDLRSCPEQVRATFPAFAQRLAGDGFAFLCERFQAGDVGGPILAAVADQRVVGAIGPMEIMPDSTGVARLLPQYFGVLPEYRGRGYGRALWRAAMHWGQHNGAAYQLLQTEVGGASEQLYLSEGLATLGFVYSTPA